MNGVAASWTLRVAETFSSAENLIASEINSKYHNLLPMILIYHTACEAKKIANSQSKKQTDRSKNWRGFFCLRKPL